MICLDFIQTESARTDKWPNCDHTNLCKNLLFRCWFAMGVGYFRNSPNSDSQQLAFQGCIAGRRTGWKKITKNA